MFKHISRNKDATIKTSQKTAHDKVSFYFGGKKNIFFPKNGGTIKKKLYH